MRPLVQEEIDSFIRNGVVCLRRLLEESWLELLRRGFERNIKEPGPYACFYTDKSTPGVFRDDYCNWTRIDEYRQVIFESQIAECAGQLLLAHEIRFFHEHIFYKKCGTVKKTPWHQDLPYYCVDGDQGLSFWIPLSSVDESNKIEFIAGSHAWGKLFKPVKFNEIDSYKVPDGLYEEMPDIDHDFPTLKVSWLMEPGDVLAFDFRTIHGNTKTNQVNLSDRKAVSLRFLGERMRYSKRPGEKSPPFPELALRAGDPMVHALFPLIWTK